MNDRQLRLTEAEEDGDEIIGNTPKRLKKELDNAWAVYRQSVKWLDLQSAVETAHARLDQAQKDYDNLLDPNLAEDTAGTRAARANAELRAPFAGTPNVDLKVGGFAASGASGDHGRFSLGGQDHRPDRDRRGQSQEGQP
jgi:hypothetical protein